MITPTRLRPIPIVLAEKEDKHQYVRNFTLRLQGKPGERVWIAVFELVFSRKTTIHDLKNYFSKEIPSSECTVKLGFHNLTPISVLYCLPLNKVAFILLHSPSEYAGWKEAKEVMFFLRHIFPRPLSTLTGKYLSSLFINFDLAPTLFVNGGKEGF